MRNLLYLILYFEYDSLTEKNFKILIQKFPEAKELFQFILTHYDRLYELLYKPSFTLNYNDFYWENFVVRKDKKAAMMFDFNLMGKGYRSSDLRNVCCSISEEAKTAFVDEYGRLYEEKHGHSRFEEEQAEKRIDDVAGELFQLVDAYIEKATFPEWANGVRNEALNGSLLSKAKKLLLD